MPQICTPQCLQQFTPRSKRFGPINLINVDNDRSAKWPFHGSIGNENVQSIRKWQVDRTLCLQYTCMTSYCQYLQWITERSLYQNTAKVTSSHIVCYVVAVKLPVYACTWVIDENKVTHK